MLTVTGGVDRWEAVRAGDQPAGVLRAWVRPDQRCQVWFRDCHPDAYGPLVSAAVAELDRDLFTEADEPSLPGLVGLGFTVWRREHRYRIPTGAVARPNLPAPSDVDLVSAGQADLDRLRRLDDALRQEIPGSDGWRWSPEEFREETFSTGFDPATYRVAVERGTGGYVGLLRVWLRPEGPRLGCIGVLPAFRRTRVTAALLGTVFRVLVERGHPAIRAEIDAANRPANALAARAGAVHTADAYTLVLPRSAGSGATRPGGPSGTRPAA
ncbi:MAG: GNAT family N-acetyltransferase [Natronosporangium sp.]